MPLVRLGAACLNQTPMDWLGNRQHIEAAIAAARDDGVSLLCLPELCVSGYGCEDMFFSPGVQDAAVESLMAIAPATHGMAVAVGLPLFYESAVYNTAALLVDGALAGFVGKQILAGDGIHYEPRWFRPWPQGQMRMTDINGVEYPVGDLLFDLGGVRVGFEICRDAWVADRPGAGLTQRGADVLLNPSASHFAFGKQDTRRRIVLEGSRSFGVSYVYCNLLGNESGRSIYDGGVMIASGGRMIAAGRRFSYRDLLLTAATVDVDATRNARAQMVDLRGPGDEGATVPRDFAWPDLPEHHPVSSEPALTPATDCLEPWERGSVTREEEFSRAVALALFDYLRRSRSQGFVVSLSGGADSSAVAVLVHLMARFAIGELGLRPFAGRLPHIGSLAELAVAIGDNGSVAGSAVEVTGRLLTCVYQATRNSSDATRSAARTIAEAVGSQFYEWGVDGMVNGYVETVAEAIGRDLTWEADDVALQNIQARARGPAVWLLANLRGALLLATSNRSEAAVGYTTMDGDTCGGLSPIAGIDKDFLRRWLWWMETEGPAGVGTLPEVAAVNRQQPTAELRPPAAEQTDEGDLMPYEVLDAIERAAIRDKRLPVAVYEIMRTKFPDREPRQLGLWVERFFQLWSRNQWKRERYAPSFHLDDESLDPKTWCRFPILNSGFEEELAELREVLERL